MSNDVLSPPPGAASVATSPPRMRGHDRRLPPRYSTPVARLHSPGPEHAGLLTVEEGNFVDGRWVVGRSLAGDDSDQGQYLELRKPSVCCMPPAKANRIQRLTLYRYR